MRNMSFAHTKKQVADQTKTVTRRLGWRFLKAGDLVQPVEKTMGLKKGEKVKRLGPPIRIVSVGREWICKIRDDDIVREGFLGQCCCEFIHFFCRINHCSPSTEVTRIEFEYTEEAGPSTIARGKLGGFDRADKRRT